MAGAASRYALQANTILLFLSAARVQESADQPGRLPCCGSDTLCGRAGRPGRERKAGDQVLVCAREAALRSAASRVSGIPSAGGPGSEMGYDQLFEPQLDDGHDDVRLGDG